MFPEALAYTPDDLRVGLGTEFEQDVTEADVLDFARVSGDYNPLHVDAAYAADSSFRGRIAHGAYQVGLASALLGMYLPGKHVLLGSVNARFPAPLYFPGRVKVRGELTAWNRAQRVGQLRVVVLQKRPGCRRRKCCSASRSTTPRRRPRRPPRQPSAARHTGRWCLTGAAGGRLVVLGSTSGSHHPLVSRAAYSLGKAALEHTVKLLAPELARKNITVNVVGPSFMAPGMNKQTTERRLKLEMAQVPLGRLCAPEDVAGAVRYLLSPAAGFVSGQLLGLTGGQL
jgi:acyl dehydratase